MNTLIYTLLLSKLKILNSKNIISIVRDKNNKIVFVNSALCEASGNNEKFFKNKDFKQLIDNSVINYPDNDSFLFTNDGNINKEIFFLTNEHTQQWYQKEEFKISLLSFRFSIFLGYNITRYVNNFNNYFTDLKLEKIGADVTSIFLTEKDKVIAVNKTLSYIGTELRVSRVNLFENQIMPDNEIISMKTFEWSAEGVSTISKVIDKEAFSLSKYAPAISKALLKGDCVNVKIKDLPTSEQQIFNSVGVLSILVVPIIIDGNCWGHIGFDECFFEKKWSEREVETIKITANSIGLFLKYKSAENERIIQAEKLDTALKNSRQGMWIWDLVSGKIEISEEISLLLGYSKEEIGNTLGSWVTRIHPDDETQVLYILHQHAEGVTDYYESEYRFLCKDGSYRWILDRGKIFNRDGRGQPVMAIGTHADIQHIKDLQQILEEKDKSFRLLFESNPMPMMLLSKENLDILDTNVAAQSLYGYTEPEFLKISSSDIWPAAEEESLRCTIKGTTLDYNHGSEFVNKKKDGNLFFTNHYSSEVVYGGETCILVVEQDITEHKLNEQDLVVSEEKYRSVVSSLSEGVILRMLNGGTTTCNKAAEEILGYTQEEITKQDALGSFENGIHPDGKTFTPEEHPFTVTFRTGRKQIGIIMGIVNASKHLKWITINTVPLMVEGDLHPYAVVVTFRDITDALDKERQLKESEDNFRNLFNNFSELIFILDTEGNIIKVNETTLTRLGYSEEELIGKSVLSVHPADMREEASRIVMQMLQGTSEYCPIPLQAKNGILIPVETRITRGKWSGRDVLLGNSKDISEMKESEEKFRSIFDSSPVPIGISEEDGVIIDANQAFLEYSNYKKSQVIGSASADVGLFFDLNQRKDILNIIAEKGFVRNYEIILKGNNDTPKVGLFSGEHVHLQGKKLLISTVTDITEARRLDVENKEYRRRFESFFNSLQEAVFILDVKKDEYLFLNPAASIIHEMPIEELKKGSEVAKRSVHPEDLEKLNSAIAEAYEGKIVTREIRITFSDGKTKWLLIRIWAKLDAHGEPQFLEGISSNITEMKMTQENLRESLEKEKELNELKTMFVATTSHEFRTPLAGILSSIEILESYSQNWSEEKKERHYSKIKGSVRHMIKMLNDILILNKSDMSKVIFEPENVSIFKNAIEIVEELNAVNHSKQIVFLYDTNISTNTYFLDIKLMTQVFSNLLTNAVKYSKTDSRIFFELRESDSYLTATVKDNGIGMNEKTLEHIFEPFFRSSDVKNIAGTGLGMAIVKKAVEFHGGTIKVNSILGEGTTVIIRIPVSAEIIQHSAVNNLNKFNVG